MIKTSEGGEYSVSAPQARALDAAPEKPENAELGFLVASVIIYGVCMTVAGFSLWRHIPDGFGFYFHGRRITLPLILGQFVGDFSNYVEISLLIPALFLVELIFTGWKESSLRHLIQKMSPSSKIDVMYFLFVELHFFYFLGRILMLFVSIDVGNAIHDAISHATGYAISISWMGKLPEIVVYFLVYSFFDYWAHRLDHTAIFWPLHRFHHAAEDFCMMTAVRAHPVGLTTVISAIPLAILGASPWTIVAFNIVKNVVGFMSHSRIRQDFGFWGRWVFLAPVNHRLHHKLDISEPVGHFGVIPLWDQLFGTFTGKADPDLVIGVAEPYGRGSRFFLDLLRDYLDFWLALVRAVLQKPRILIAGPQLSASASPNGGLAELSPPRSIEPPGRKSGGAVARQSGFGAPVSDDSH